VNPSHRDAVLELARARGAAMEPIGRTVRARELRVQERGETRLSLDLDRIEPRWRSAVEEVLR